MKTRIDEGSIKYLFSRQKMLSQEKTCLFRQLYGVRPNTQYTATKTLADCTIMPHCRTTAVHPRALHPKLSPTKQDTTTEQHEYPVCTTSHTTTINGIDSYEATHPGSTNGPAEDLLPPTILPVERLPCQKSYCPVRRATLLSLVQRVSLQAIPS